MFQYNSTAKEQKNQVESGADLSLNRTVHLNQRFPEALERLDTSLGTGQFDQVPKEVLVIASPLSGQHCARDETTSALTDPLWQPVDRKGLVSRLAKIVFKAASCWRLCQRVVIKLCAELPAERPAVIHP